MTANELRPLAGYIRRRAEQLRIGYARHGEWLDQVATNDDAMLFVSARNLRALLDRLKTAEENVRKANAQAEHFEREWYLRGDEIERLRDALEAVVAYRTGGLIERLCREALENTNAR